MSDWSVDRRGLTLVGTAAVVLAGAVVAARTVDLDAAADAVAGADPRLLAAAVGVYVASWPVRGRRYDDVLAAMDRRCGVAFLTAATFVSQTANLAVPARAGDGTRAWLLEGRRDVPYATGFASLAVERAFDLVAVATLGAAALAWVVVGGAATEATAGEAGAALWAAGAVAALAVAGAAVVLALARSDRAFGAALRERVRRPRLRALADAAVRFGGAIRTVAASPRAIAVVGAGSLAVWSLDVLTAVLVLAAIDTGLAAPSLVAVGTLAVSVGNLAKVLPLTQGGVGLYEAAFTAVAVAAAPVGAGAALAAAVLDHALKNAVTLGGGGLAALWLNVSPAAAPRSDERPPASEEPAD